MKIKSVTYKFVELFIIFVLFPISLAIHYAIWIKMTLGILGFAYVVYILLKVENNKFKMAPNLNWKRFWKETLLKFFIITLVTTMYMWFVDKENLFVVVLNKPMMWISILFVYSIFSVYPQELIYRTFFFQRYEKLFKSDWLFMVFNAALFSLAHIFFRNTLVMFLTFIGGLLFAISFKKSRSTLLVSIEHAIYGCWLFTVGMGNMLGFPS